MIILLCETRVCNLLAYFVFAAIVDDEGGQVGDMKIPEFHGDSYMEIPLRKRVGKMLKFEIWLLAKQPDGW